MITKVTGVLNRVLDEDVRIQVGPWEHQVMVPECVRRQLQTRTGQEVTLHTTEFYEGNQMSNRLVRRLIGFQSEADLEFYELLCTVEKIGVRKALKAMIRPAREIAEAVHRQDAKWLTTLPGIGTALAEQVITTLKRKVTKFVALPPTNGEAGPEPTAVVNGSLLDDAYIALLSLGHNPVEARTRLDAVVSSRQPYQSVEDILTLIYKTK
jgi:holliday junction DNA helicase RuvA